MLTHGPKAESRNLGQTILAVSEVTTPDALRMQAVSPLPSLPLFAHLRHLPCLPLCHVHAAWISSEGLQMINRL